MEMIEHPFQGMQVTVDPSSVRETGMLDVVGFVPGPAGMVSTGFGGDVTVSVDYADPGRMSSVEIPLGAAGPDLELMVALFGPQGWQVLRSSIDARLDHPIVTPLGKPRSLRDVSSGRTGDRPALDFGTAVAGLSVTDDADEHPLVRATAALESLRAVWESSGLGESLIGDASGRRRVDRWMTDAVEALRDDLYGDQRLVELDPGTYRYLQRCAMVLVDRYAKGPRWTRDLVRVLPERLIDLDSRRRQRAARSTAADEPLQMARMMVSMAASQYLLSDPAVIQALEELPSDGSSAPPGSPRLELASPGRLRVVFAEEPSGSWLRVLDRSSLGLLAVVPIQRERSAWLAEAIVPADAGLDDLQIVVADAPVPTEGGSSISRTLGAIDAGRRATMLDTRDDRRAAAAQWRACAVLWRDLGDETRANLADAYATGRERVRRRSQVHDDVRRLVD